MSTETCWMWNSCSRKHCNDPSGCLILTKLNFLYKEANVPPYLRVKRTLVVDSDESDLEAFRQLSLIQQNILSFVGEGKSLYIWSTQAGNGKTSWALRLLQTYFNKIWLNSPLRCRALFINVPFFLQALKDNISIKSEYISHIKENASQCDLIIWDDISNKIGTDFEINSLLSIIDSRLIQGKSNIYTSNVPPADLKNYLDIRLGSRIATASNCIQLVGGDKRGLQIKEG